MGSIPHLSILKGSSRHLKTNSIHNLFEEVCKKSPENIATIFEDAGRLKKTTYKDLNAQTNQIARLIQSKIQTESLPRNSDGDYIVAVCMQPTDLLVSTLLSIWKAGIAYLPLDPAFPAARIEHIINESKPVLVIYDEDFESFNGAAKLSIGEVLKQSEKFCVDDIHDEDRLKCLRDDLAVVLYTSGSTGVPKGVRLPHKMILNRLQWQFRAFPYSDSERVGVFKTALTFVDSISEIWGPLVSGLSILVVPKATTKDPEKLVAILEEFKIERLVLVPSLLRSLLMFLELQKGESALANLRIWVCSGETLSVSLSEEFFKYFKSGNQKLCNFYGSTEIMGDVSYHILSSAEDTKYQSKIPIGVPVDNTILYLLDKDYRPVKAGEVGELFVAGLNLASGYVNGRDPEKFIENPLAIDPTYSRLFRTGDFARVVQGRLEFEGRTDSQVKIRGHRVDLAEVEKAIMQIPEVDKCVVLCYKPGEMNQALLAFVTTSALMGENQIENLLREKLTSYMVPQVILMESIPLLVNGKIDRQALLKSYENTNNNDDLQYQPEIDYAGVPENQMVAAKVLFETVASVLNRAARSVISINANFYEIGGNSLNSIFTITNISEKGYHISIGDFIAAIDLGEVLERMSPTTQQLILNSQPPLFRSEKLSEPYREIVLDMITTSFHAKAELEQLLMPGIYESDYIEMIDQLWSPLLQTGFSFVAISEETGKVIGVALNFDAHDEPEVVITSKLNIIFEFLESIEAPIRDKQLPQGKGKVLHSFMMATHSSLSPKENVAVMKFMEDEVLKLAKESKFVGILTTNTSPLTQQLGESVYGYKCMLNCQINEYVAADKSKPFGHAEDQFRAIVHWKEI